MNKQTAWQEQVEKAWHVQAPSYSQPIAWAGTDQQIVQVTLQNVVPQAFMTQDKEQVVQVNRAIHEADHDEITVGRPARQIFALAEINFPSKQLDQQKDRGQNKSDNAGATID